MTHTALAPVSRQLIVMGDEKLEGNLVSTTVEADK